MDTRKQYLAFHASNGDLMSMHEHLIAWYIVQGYLEPVVSDVHGYSGLTLTNTGKAWLYHAPDSDDTRVHEICVTVYERGSYDVEIRENFNGKAGDTRFVVSYASDPVTWRADIKSAIAYVDAQFEPQPATCTPVSDSGAYTVEFNHRTRQWMVLLNGVVISLVDELRSGDIERLLNTETESLRSQLAAANSELASMKARVAELTIQLGEALEQGIKLDERNRKLERKLDNLD
jgi:hypothetical protein